MRAKPWVSVYTGFHVGKISLFRLINMPLLVSSFSFYYDVRGLKVSITRRRIVRGRTTSLVMILVNLYYYDVFSILVAASLVFLFYEITIACNLYGAVGLDAPETSVCL